MELWFAVLSHAVGDMRGSKIRKRLSGTVDWVYTSSLITSESPAGWLPKPWPMRLVVAVRDGRLECLCDGDPVVCASAEICNMQNGIARSVGVFSQRRVPK